MVFFASQNGSFQNLQAVVLQMLNNLSDREKLYDDIRRECEVSFDGGVCLELLIDEVDNKKLKNLLEEYIIKTCNELSENIY